MQHLLFFLLILFFFLPSVSCASYDDPTSFVYAGCSEPKYSPNTPYQYNLNSLLASLANSASMSNYANFTSSVASALASVYGLFQCRGDMSIPTCNSCVRAAINQLNTLCYLASGATLQLHGCVVRYGNDSFIGEPDTTLVYKKCGATNGGSDTDLLGMRESVVGGLEAGQGPFRVSRAGNVDGSAQCVGDQNAKDCDICLKEAVADLRNACGGPSVTGEVYLGKCYVEYSWSGQASTSGRHGTILTHESGKRMAIIIGIAVAVLVFILLLYFLSKSAMGKGK